MQKLGFWAAGIAAWFTYWFWVLDATLHFLGIPHPWR